MTQIENVQAGALDVAYHRHGPRGGPPVVLLHGFPYDVHAYDEVAPLLAASGADVIVPYLRGYGPTRFLDAATMRSGQQAALAHDLHDLLAALDVDPAVVAGYDWGGRAACLVSMLWPERVAGLVTAGGYNVQHISQSEKPAAPSVERTYWYQYYLHGTRGANGLAANRREFARLLWHEWSPGWAFTKDDVDATAPSFDNPDFVDVVVHSYRHRYGLVPGDPAYQDSEDAIAEQPTIDVSTVVLDGTASGFGAPPSTNEHRRHFPDLVEHRHVATGHNVPQEAPAEFAEAVAHLRF